MFLQSLVLFSPEVLMRSIRTSELRDAEVVYICTYCCGGSIHIYILLMRSIRTSELRDAEVVYICTYYYVYSLCVSVYVYI
jgi:hypothetical protein